MVSNPCTAIALNVFQSELSTWCGLRYSVYKRRLHEISLLTTYRTQYLLWPPLWSIQAFTRDRILLITFRTVL